MNVKDLAKIKRDIADVAVEKGLEVIRLEMDEENKDLKEYLMILSSAVNLSNIRMDGKEFSLDENMIGLKAISMSTKEEVALSQLGHVQSVFYKDDDLIINFKEGKFLLVNFDMEYELEETRKEMSSKKFHSYTAEMQEVDYFLNADEIKPGQRAAYVDKEGNVRATPIVTGTYGHPMGSLIVYAEGKNYTNVDMEKEIKTREEMEKEIELKKE